MHLSRKQKKINNVQIKKNAHFLRVNTDNYRHCSSMKKENVCEKAQNEKIHFSRIPF